jgi:hypothetical protein
MHTTVRIQFEREHIMLREAAEMELTNPRIDVSVNMQKEHGCIRFATSAELTEIKPFAMGKDPVQWETNAPVLAHVMAAGDGQFHTVESMLLRMTHPPV